MTDIIRVYVSRDDETTAQEIADVISGESDAFDLIGLIGPDGVEVTVRVALAPLHCPVCGDEYNLDDGIDWEACPAHVDDVDPYSDKNREAAAQATRIDAAPVGRVEPKRYVVVDTYVAAGQRTPVLGRFDTEDEAATFIETLPDYLTGRYGLDGPADD